MWLCETVVGVRRGLVMEDVEHIFSHYFFCFGLVSLSSFGWMAGWIHTCRVGCFFGQRRFWMRLGWCGRLLDDDGLGQASSKAVLFIRFYLGSNLTAPNAKPEGKATVLSCSPGIRIVVEGIFCILYSVRNNVTVHAITSAQRAGTDHPITRLVQKLPATCLLLGARLCR